MSATVGECPRQWGNVHNSGKIEYVLRSLRLEIVIYNSAHITSEDTWNNMPKAHYDLR